MEKLVQGKSLNNILEILNKQHSIWQKSGAG